MKSLPPFDAAHIASSALFVRLAKPIEAPVPAAAGLVVAVYALRTGEQAFYLLDPVRRALVARQRSADDFRALVSSWCEHGLAAWLDAAPPTAPGARARTALASW
jgi:hypothetical protein